jgi:hypothetical protein
MLAYRVLIGLVLFLPYLAFGEDTRLDSLASFLLPRSHERL